MRSWFMGETQKNLCQKSQKLRRVPRCKIDLCNKNNKATARRFQRDLPTSYAHSGELFYSSVLNSKFKIKTKKKTN